MMGAVKTFASDWDHPSAEKLEPCDLGFLPKNLTTQCRSLIESFHDVHGFACLPDILWKSRLGPFIEKHRVLSQFLKKASTTRSAKKSHEGFVQIATTILSLEILASSFAGWSAIYPGAGEEARAILKRNANSAHMPLMEFYLYPPKYVGPSAAARLAPPARQQGEAEFYRASNPELLGEKRALDFINQRKANGQPTGVLPSQIA
jgi:hypothetical protein